jgi:hypothetical protein
VRTNQNKRRLECDKRFSIVNSWRLVSSKYQLTRKQASISSVLVPILERCRSEEDVELQEEEGVDLGEGVEEVDLVEGVETFSQVLQIQLKVKIYNFQSFDNL